MLGTYLPCWKQRTFVKLAFSSTFSYLVNFTHIPWDVWQRPTNRMLTVSINLSYVINLQSKQCSLVYWPAVHLWLTTNCKESANRQLIVFQQISTGSFVVFSCFLSFLEVHKVAIFFIVETSFKAWIFTLLSTIFFFATVYYTGWSGLHGLCHKCSKYQSSHL